METVLLFVGQSHSLGSKLVRKISELTKSDIAISFCKSAEVGENVDGLDVRAFGFRQLGHLR